MSMMSICSSSSPVCGFSQRRMISGVSSNSRKLPSSSQRSVGGGRGCKLIAHAKTPEYKIDNLSTDYCNDFECTSSPAVAQTVKSLARDIQRQRLTEDLYSRNAIHNDGFRSCEGLANLPRTNWIRAKLDRGTRTTVQRLQMLDKGTAQIDWTLTGNLGPLPLDISYKSVAQMNLLTGKVVDYKMSWDLSRCSAPAQALATLDHMLWSAQQGLGSASGTISNKVNDALNSLDGSDSDSNDSYKDVADPTRMFQDQGNSDQNKEYITFGLVVAMLYLFSKFLGQVVTL